MRFPIANVLTWTRILMIPLVVLLFYLPFKWSSPAAACVFIAAAITDSLDGYLARRLQQISALGAFLDPVADKLMVATALVLVVSHAPKLAIPHLPLDGRSVHVLLVLAAAIIIGREITISALREWMAEIGARAKVAVSGLGKLKTIAQMVGLSLLLFREDFFGIPIYEIGVATTIVAAGLTLWSMMVYLRSAWPHLTGSVPLE